MATANQVMGEMKNSIDKFEKIINCDIYFIKYAKNRNELFILNN